MDVGHQDPFGRIASLISGAIPKAGCEERTDLEQAVSIFTACVAKALAVPPFVRMELELQMQWIDRYNSHQDSYPSYRRSPNESILPIMQDEESLLAQFAREIFDGARLIGELYGVRPVRPWISVDRHRKYERISRNVEQEHTNEPSAPEPGVWDDESVFDATEYTYAYF